MPESSISRLSNQYHSWIRTHPNAAQDFRAVIEDLLNDAGVVFDRVSARVKSWPSLKTKAKKKHKSGELIYPSPWEDIHDIVGVRVTVFHSTAIPDAIRVLADAFHVIRSVDKAAETRISGGFGYGSHHLVVQAVASSEIAEELADYLDTHFEIQIRTVLQHAWAEFEHDIRYKQGMAAPSPQMDRLFTLAAGLIELADQQFDEIVALNSPKHQTDDNVELNSSTLPGILMMLLENRFPLSRSDHYSWLTELLDLNGINTLAQLQELLTEDAIAQVHQAMNYRFPPGHVRLLDDLLLFSFGEEHIAATSSTGNRKDRKKQLENRLRKIRHSSS